MKNPYGEIRGTVCAGAVIRGKITIPQYIGGELYNGEYVVTPRVTEQTLPTAQKIMADDVTVKKIPRYDVSNKSGKTVYIGIEIEE